ncbi:MAG TPA: HsmA family protein [Coriobacteriia bacterium]
MTPTLILAIVSMVLAATLYTVAVFGERAAHVLRPWHLGLFWLGLVFDTTGTTLMARIAGGWKWDVHGVVGLTAVALMLVHSAWATVVLVLKKERALRDFHRFSIHVWALWMAALVSGIVLVAMRAA